MTSNRSNSDESDKEKEKIDETLKNTEDIKKEINWAWGGAAVGVIGYLIYTFLLN